MDDLRRSIEALRAVPEGELLQGIDAACHRFEKHYLSKCAQSLAVETGMSAEMLAFGLQRSVDAHRRPHLARWLHEAQQEAGHSLPGCSKVLLHILPGNVPGLAIPASIESLLARCPAFLKAAEGDRIVPRYWVKALQETNAVLSQSVAWEYWKGGEASVEGVRLAEADAIIASGDKSTLYAIEDRVQVPVIQHGPKFSVGLVGDSWTGAPSSWWREVARECVLWEQRGCLSPVFMFVKGSLEHFAQELAHAFGYWSEVWPPPPKSLDQAVAQRNFHTHFELQPESQSQCIGDCFTVGWAREVLPFLPQGRCVSVHPWGELSHALELYRGQIQAVGTAWDPELLPGLPEVVFPLNTIQNPPAGWRADGRSVLAELLA